MNLPTFDTPMDCKNCTTGSISCSISNVSNTGNERNIEPKLSSATANEVKYDTTFLICSTSVRNRAGYNCNILGKSFGKISSSSIKYCAVGSICREASNNNTDG